MLYVGFAKQQSIPTQHHSFCRNVPPPPYFSSYKLPLWIWIASRSSVTSINDSDDDREGLKITNFPEAVGCETRTSSPFKKLQNCILLCLLKLSMWKRSKHTVVERNSSVLTFALLDRRMTELTDHRGKPVRFEQAWLSWMARPVIQPWCGARNAGSRKSWKSSLGTFSHQL